MVMMTHTWDMIKKVIQVYRNTMWTIENWCFWQFHKQSVKEKENWLFAEAQKNKWKKVIEEQHAIILMVYANEYK